MWGRALVVAASLGLVACARHVAAPPPDLPPPPAPWSGSSPAPRSEGVEEEAATASPLSASRAAVPVPAALGDTELDSLRIGFWGCRVLGTRLAPSMSGRALLRVHIGPAGEVLDAAPERVEGLPRAVVVCLLRTVLGVRFAPRGGAGSELYVPVDFSDAQPGRAVSPRTPVPTQSL